MNQEKSIPFYRINADDLGMSEEINEKIAKAYLAGKISTASLLVKRPSYRHALLVCPKKMPLGLHIELTDNYNSFFAKYMKNEINIENIKKSIDYQVTKFLRTGRKLNHIDSHLGVHFFPKIFKIVAETALKKDVFVRNPIRRINWNIFDWKQFINDNVQWVFYQTNKKYKIKSFNWMIESKGTTEVIWHAE